MPPDYVVNRRLLSGEHRSPLAFPWTQNEQPKHQLSNNPSKINAWKFSHAIRWRLQLPGIGDTLVSVGAAIGRNEMDPVMLKYLADATALIFLRLGVE
jgi:hypothetical protein